MKPSFRSSAVAFVAVAVDDDNDACLRQLKLQFVSNELNGNVKYYSCAHLHYLTNFLSSIRYIFPLGLGLLILTNIKN